MPHITITPNSLKQDLGHSWKSIESYLEQNKHSFEINDFDQVITVEVSDKTDALRLAGLLSLSTVEYQSGNTREVLKTHTPKKYGRPKNSVFTEAEILKRRILTKTELEKAIASNKLETIPKGNTVRIDKESLVEFLRKRRLTL